MQAPVSPQGPAKKKLPVALLVLFGVLAGPLPMVGIFVWVWWAGHDARDFVRVRFAEVRKDPEPFVDEAPDEDTRAAYELVAKSSGESIFPLSPSSSTASSLSDWETRVCINPDLTVKGKTKTIGVLVVERKVRGKPKMELTMSVTRSCTCNGRRKPCRLE